MGPFKVVLASAGLPPAKKRPRIYKTLKYLLMLAIF
jgi:hypothetical protein